MPTSDRRNYGASTELIASPATFMLECGAYFFGVSHSPVVHELWVLVVGGSNPPTPTTFRFAQRVSGRGICDELRSDSDY